MTPGISVIICCYNSEQRISPTLQHLAVQGLPKHIPWEIILVDNCCTDNTITAAQQTWEVFSSGNIPPLQMIQENTPGLSNARRAGVYAARYEIICFCDDDNWLHQDYLSRAWEIMNEQVEIGILAGQGIPTSSVTIPDWFDEHKISFACGKLAEESGELVNGNCPWGAGMILRNDTLRKMYKAGFNHLNSDRKGNSLSSGGDTELCYWHLLCNKKMWYDERLVFTHYIPSERLSIMFAEALNIEHEKAHNNLYPYISLIHSKRYEHTPKIILLFKALLSIVQRRDGSQIYVHLQPIFNFRLNKNTQQILKHLRNYKANF